MTDLQRQRALALYVGSKGPVRSLLVDADEDLRRVLAEAGAEVGIRNPQIAGRPYDAADLWFGTRPEHYRLVVLARKAASKDLFRDLSICGRLVASSGAMAILCLSDAVADHCYQEASEIFVSAEIGWSRTLHQASNVVELRRTS